MEVIELKVEDDFGQTATLVIYPGLLDEPMRYQEFNKQGFLSDEKGNLIDLEGNILVSAKDLATLINRQKRGEKVEMPQGIMVAIIFEEGDKIVDEPKKGILELDPSSELAEG
jgi:hypothetical protein